MRKFADVSGADALSGAYVADILVPDAGAFSGPLSGACADAHAFSGAVARPRAGANAITRADAGANPVAFTAPDAFSGAHAACILGAPGGRLHVDLGV